MLMQEIQPNLLVAGPTTDLPSADALTALRRAEVDVVVAVGYDDSALRVVSQNYSISYLRAIENLAPRMLKDLLTADVGRIIVTASTIDIANEVARAGLR